MTGNYRRFLSAISLLFVMAGVSVFTGCASGSYAAKGATQGAATGAVSGAVGGMISALVFGGDVAEAGARGAVYGGATGAVVGGMSGSRADQEVAAREQAENEAELARLRNQIGTDAYGGVVALADCKHDVAIAFARESAKSKNRDYALAGLWVEALTEADRQHETAARALFPEIIQQDREIRSESEAEAAIREVLHELGALRVEYDMPSVCST